MNRSTDLTPYLEDAAHFPGGHAAGIVFPRTVDEVAEAVASAPAVLPIGAQSSLTGGATPMGELIVSTARMRTVIDQTADTVTVQAGITIDELQQHLAQRGAWFPPAPTFTGACAGGTVATNAAGAATFKYGSTRDWVAALGVVLADGSFVRLRRGEQRASAGRLAIAGREVAIPTYRVPAVAKVSAGYFASAGMDAVDLFIGSEGTLGVIIEITFRVVSFAPHVALAMIPCRSEEQAIELAGELRRSSLATRAAADPQGLDVCAIENVDRRGIEILNEDGILERENVAIAPDTQSILFAQIELPADIDAGRAYQQIADMDAKTGLGRFCRLVSARSLLDQTAIALPGDARRVRQLMAVREAIPAGVNRRVGLAQRDVDPRISKTAADMIVPFERFADMAAIYRRGFERRGLDYAIWGHISDGNVHPNVIPRSYADVERGCEAILEFGVAAARLGGCPLAEHGVGRNAVKQALLRQLYGDKGIAEMRAVKRALDPAGKLSPGVIFPVTD
jgi:D-lactate dehydrogenase (cytochrome)